MDKRPQQKNIVSSEFEAVPEQRQTPSENVASLHSSPSSPVLSRESLDAVGRLVNVLIRINQQMKSEGYEIRDGEIRKITTK